MGFLKGLQQEFYFPPNTVPNAKTPPPPPHVLNAKNFSINEQYCSNFVQHLFMIFDQGHCYDLKINIVYFIFQYRCDIKTQDTLGETFQGASLNHSYQGRFLIYYYLLLPYTIYIKRILKVSYCFFTVKNMPKLINLKLKKGVKIVN